MEQELDCWSSVVGVSVCIVVWMGCCRSRPVVSTHVLNRRTHTIMYEHVPAYLHSVYNLMYNTRLGRRILIFNFTTSILKRATNIAATRANHVDSHKLIAAFMSSYGVDESECERPVSDYRTLNEFFTRKLKSGVRPVEFADNSAVIVSPADCRLLVFDRVRTIDEVTVKGYPMSVARLLHALPTDITQRFLDAAPAVAICRLAPQDYHRWHLPVGPVNIGTVTAVDGTYYSVSPIALRALQVFETNKRQIYTFQHEQLGTIIMVAVGAAMVSSIQLEAGMDQSGRRAEKGDPHGFFEFGGSTLVLLFEADKVQFDRDLIVNSASGVETYVRCGERIAASMEWAAEETRNGSAPHHETYDTATMAIADRLMEQVETVIAARSLWRRILFALIPLWILTRIGYDETSVTGTVVADIDGDNDDRHVHISTSAADDSGIFDSAAVADEVRQVLAEETEHWIHNADNTAEDAALLDDTNAETSRQRRRMSTAVD